MLTFCMATTRLVLIFVVKNIGCCKICNKIRKILAEACITIIMESSSIILFCKHWSKTTEHGSTLQLVSEFFNTIHSWLPQPHKTRCPQITTPCCMKCFAQCYIPIDAVFKLLIIALGKICDAQFYN